MRLNYLKKPLNQNKMGFINPNNNKLEKHIDYCQYMLGICNRKSNRLRPYYFKKQIEVAQKKLKQIFKSE